ncbi:hypothetical protein QF037_006394 [Streptomyces canus]|nr:hypothetical protein [Streptomyces canus]
MPRVCRFSGWVPAHSSAVSLRPQGARSDPPRAVGQRAGHRTPPGGHEFAALAGLLACKVILCRAPRPGVEGSGRADERLPGGQLRGSLLLTPGALERLDFLHQFADRFDIQDRAASVNLGLTHFLADVAQDPRRFSLLPADVPLPEVLGLRSIPLVNPAPLYAWSLLWRTGNGHPGLDGLTAACAAQAGQPMAGVRPGARLAARTAHERTPGQSSLEQRWNVSSPGDFWRTSSVRACTSNGWTRRRARPRPRSTVPGAGTASSASGSRPSTSWLRELKSTGRRVVVAPRAGGVAAGREPVHDAEVPSALGAFSRFWLVVLLSRSSLRLWPRAVLSLYAT